MIKVSVIGAGSSYTPELIEGFVESWSDLPVSQVTLMDIDERRLDVVAGLARRMVETAGVDIRIEQTLQRREAIEGSRFVVSQIRVGGVDARLLDETIPPRFGVIGQETTGPGGFAKALRTIPVVLGIASDVEVSAPGAVLVNFTNPAGLITEALQRHSAVQAIGLCNLPIGMEMRVAEQLGVERGRVRLDWVGLNHLNWTRGVTIDGRDVWPEVFAGAIELARKSVEDGWTFSAELLETLGMIPCGYLNYYYNHDKMLARQRAAEKSRAQEVQEIEARLLEMYADPDLSEKPKLLEERGGAYYSKAAVALISAIANDKGELHIVNTPNRGAIPDLPAGAVVEVPCLVGADGAEPERTAPLQPEIRGLVQAVKAFEELTVRAAVEGDRRLALQALLAHPPIRSFQTAQGLLEALLQAHREYLPQFFGET